MNPSDVNPSGRRWWRKPSRFIPLTIVALVIVAMVGLKIASKTGLQAELDAIRAKGLPTNPSELDAWYARVPASENAALKLLEAQGHYVAAADKEDPGTVEWREIPHDQPLNAETLRILEKHIHRNTETLQQLRGLAEMEQSRYPVDLSLAPNLMLPHLPDVRRLAQLTRWEATLKAEHRDGAGAAEAIRIGFAAARTLVHEPLLISELVRQACVAIQVAGMERVVNVAPLGEAELNSLLEVIRTTEEDTRQGFYRALVGDRAFANTGKQFSFEDFESAVTLGGMVPMTGSNLPEFVRRTLYLGRTGLGFDARDRAFYLRGLGLMIDRAPLEHPEFLRSMNALSDQLQAELDEHPYVYQLAGISLPTMLSAPRRQALIVARLRCVAAALEIERWRLKNGGRVPNTHELVPAVFQSMPLDPIDGSPLKYERGQARGYKVTAAGATASERERGVTKAEIEFIIVR